MDKFDRIQQLHRLFLKHHFPIPLGKIAQALECTSKTAKHAIDLLRDQLQAPLIYHPDTKGWQYDKTADAFELPGLWLTADELHGLAAILQILNNMDEGLLGKEITVVEQHIKKLLNAKGVDITTFSHSVKYLSTRKRPVINRYFLVIVDALIHQKQLAIHYSDYAGYTTQRTISPQTLVHYQENWYLDAWCHKRHALRSFMLPRISKVIKQAEASTVIPEDECKEHYQSSYGIFAGKAKHRAELRFYAPAAREAASIQWHPEQQTHWQGDHYHIIIPYNDDRELIRDILKYGNNIEVIKPAALKNKIKRIAQSMVTMYSGNV
jgi:proteasome accessory factor C